MKFSKREKHIIDVMRRHAGENISFDMLLDGYAPERQSKFFRGSFFVSVRRLKEKLSAQGIKFERISFVGRGHQAVFYVPDEMKTFSPEN